MYYTSFNPLWYTSDMLRRLSFQGDDDPEQIKNLNCAAVEVFEAEPKTSDVLFSGLDERGFPIEGKFNNVAALVFSAGGIVMEHVLELAERTPLERTPEQFHCIAESLLESPRPGLITKRDEVQQRLLKRVRDELNFRLEAIRVTPLIREQCPPAEGIALPPLVGNSALDAARSSDQKRVVEYIDHLLMVTIRLIILRRDALTTFYNIIQMSR